MPEICIAPQLQATQNSVFSTAGENLSMKCWTLYLVLPGRFGPIISGFLILITLTALQLSLVGDYFWISTGIFFAVILSYLPAVYVYILNITQKAITELRPNLEVSNQNISAVVQRMERPGARFQITCLTIGMICGLLHINFMGFIPITADGQLDFSATLVKIYIVGTCLTWCMMTTVISSLIQNSFLIGNLANHLKQIDLFSKQPWQPLARVAIASSLALIGSNAIFPLLFIDNTAEPASKILPGMALTIPSVAAMVMLPLAAARRRIAAQKTLRLLSIDQAIAKLPEPKSHIEMQTLNTLLDQRNHLQRVSSWPLNLGNIGRLLFYMFIPPLTWVGAALIERLVDGFV
jgi:TM2 domain-containing membrane protein YozV